MTTVEDASEPVAVSASSPEEFGDDVPLTPVSGLKRILFLGMAAVFLALGLAGAVLPGLPTTPFLLLMSYFLLRSSPRLHAKVLSWPVVGGPLRDWSERGGVRPGVKWLAFAMVLPLVTWSIAFSDLPPFGKVIVAIAAVIGLTVVYRLPIARDPEPE